LTVSGNWIGDEGAVAIAGAIRGLTAMAMLSLGCLRGEGEIE
jgi:hypothetical protein